MIRPLATFSFLIFLSNFSYFHTHRPSFLPVPPSSSSLLPPRPSFFLSQHCLNHSKSVKVHFSSILTKALRTDGPTNRPTNKPTDKASYKDAMHWQCIGVVILMCVAMAKFENSLRKVNWLLLLVVTKRLWLRCIANVKSNCKIIQH